jgi:hypothetical protein
MNSSSHRTQSILNNPQSPHHTVTSWRNANTSDAPQLSTNPQERHKSSEDQGVVLTGASAPVLQLPPRDFAENKPPQMCALSGY